MKIPLNNERDYPPQPLTKKRAIAVAAAATAMVGVAAWSNHHDVPAPGSTQPVNVEGNIINHSNPIIEREAQISQQQGGAGDIPPIK